MSRPIGLLIAAAGVAAGFIVLIQLGFIWHGDAAPPAIAAAFPFAAALFAVLALWGAAALFRNAGQAGTRRRAARALRRDADGWRREREALIARLEADPQLNAYAARMRAGESWNEDQIAYDRDPDAVTTCSHLAPIERAMRRQGIAVKLQQPGILHAQCVVDEAALDQRFALARPGWYGLVPAWDRSAEDPPAAVFRCDEHPATIFVVERGQAQPGVPAFPAQERAGAA
ncbi:hypothetical protein ACFQ1E_06605 [Sphingomonas canadensis]|uniref:Uncharacterized protein n=1 Tax=Sphingomonas canadensis TaxID=1219257 RepID=A0ABW3H3K7_9SPHN|nr:hypothetical protein [Sphingomonas canadensis]MCW3835540.1 hypothetical protein [Sphingomonas canadensis]